MGGGGTSSTGTNFGFQNTTSTTTPDPMAYNYLMGVLNMGANVGGIPYQPYTGQQLAGFTPDQMAAMQGVRNAVGTAQPYIDQAKALTNQAVAAASPSNFSQAAVNQYMNPLMSEAIRSLPIEYSQQAVSQYYDPRLQSYLNTAPLNYSADAVSKYYNPYQQQVIDATQAAIEQQNAQQMSQQQAQAIQAGAFGGDRTSAARAQLAGQQALAQNQVLGNLRQQGYQNALQAFQQQQAQALGVATQQQTQAQQMFANQQAAGLNARQQAYAQALAQYNEQQQQQIQAAQQASYAMSQLGAQSQQAKLQGLQALLGTGQLQQQLNQQQLNQEYSKWLAAQSYPYMQTAFMAGLGGLAPGLGSTTNTSGFGYGQQSNQTSGGSALGQVGGLAQMAIGMLGLSDERSKTNVDYVGKDPETGDPLYAYDYKSDVARAKKTGEPMPPKRVSPMAQEVAERRPNDVVDLGGLLGVKLDREGRAAGGTSPASAQSAMVPISTYTGSATPEGGYTDLSSLAYPTNPNFPQITSQGLGDIFTPAEEFEKIGKRWVSPDIASEDVELKPFRSHHHSDEDREERAEGGMLPDQSDFLEMSKKPPYGILSNPKVASAILPVHDISLPAHPAPDMGYIPGLPGGNKGHGGGGGGGGGGEGISMPKFGKKAASAAGSAMGTSKTTGGTEEVNKTAAAPEPSIGDKIKTGLGNLFGGGAETPATPAAPEAPPVVPETPAAPAGGFDVLGGIGNMFGGLFSHGGRVHREYGGPATPSDAVTGSMLGPITNPYGSGQVNNVPAGVGAFNTPINTGLTVQQAFGPQGLGRDIPVSLASFKMPWSAVPTGSSEYNNLLLQAAQNIGPRQLTPQEFGLPSIANNALNYAASTGTTSGGGSLASLLGGGSGASGMTSNRPPTQAQIDATKDEVKKAELQNQLDLYNLNAQYPNISTTPSNYIYQMTDWMTPEGLRFMVPVSGYSSPSFYVDPYAKTAPTYKADGGSVRGGYRQGGRPGVWGRLQDAEEGARAAALALKEDFMHPQEVLHTIWNRAKSGIYGSTPSDIMAARKQYEPMNPSNRGTSRDPRMVNPNDPKVRELSEYWNKIKSGNVEDPTGGATHFMNPDIVAQRRHGHFKPWERQGLNDPASVRVGKQIYYNPNREGVVASDKPKGDYFSNIKPAQPYGPGDSSVLSGGFGKFGEPIPSVTRPPLQDTFGQGLDLSGGPMSMKSMSEQYPIEPKGVDGRNIGIGDRDLSIGQLAGLPALADPGTPGTYSPPLNVAGTDVQVPMGNETPKGFADIPPVFGAPTSEENKVTEVHDGRNPMVKTTSVSQPRPGTHVVHERSEGFGPVARDTRRATAQAGEEGGFDLGGVFDDLFGGKDAGYLQGPDLGDLADIFGFSSGGRVGYEGGGRAKEAFDYLVNEAGATPAEAQVLVPAAAAESAFDPEAVHDQGTGFGLFGHRLERADALRKALGEKASDFKEQLGFGLKEFRGRPEHRYVEGENPSIEDIMQAHGAFERPAGYRTGQPEGMKDYNKRLAYTQAVMGGDFGAFGNYKGSASGDRVVATDRPTAASDDGDFLQPVRHFLGGDNETEPGLFGMKPLMNRDLAMYLLASGAGMAASRSRSPLQALGEGGLMGIEAMQASRAGREANALKSLQAQNLMSEMQKRNFELNEMIRKTRARQDLLRGAPAGGTGPVSEDTAAPPATVMPSTPEAPKIIEPTPSPAPAPEAAAPAAPVPAVGAEGGVTPAPKVAVDPRDAEIAKIEAEEKANRQKAQRAVDLGIPEDAKQFEDRLEKLQQQRERLMEQKRKSLTEKVGEGSPMDTYQQGQASAAAAADTSANLDELEGIIKDPKIDFGVAAPYLNMIKSGTAEAEQYFPGLKKFLPEIDTEALGRAERLGSEGNKLVLAATNGKLGAGVSNADVSFLKDTVFNISRTREYNMDVLRKQQALQQKLVAQAEEQERYRQAHGGIDANFQSHMAKWGQQHPVQSFMRKEAESKAGQIGGEKPVAKDRTIVRRGKDASGRAVVKYSDGTVGYAD